MADIDRIIHEPVRLRIVSVLDSVDLADFKFMLTTQGLTKGNLSSHIDKLEKAGYVKVNKSFHGKVTQTYYQLTKTGRKTLENYWVALDRIRTSSPSKTKTS